MIFSFLTYFYQRHILKRLLVSFGFLLPLSILLSSIYSLTRLNNARELVALLSSGIPIRKILRPFWLVACGIFAFQIINQQFFLPKARYAIDDMKNTYVRDVRKLTANEPFRLLFLKDGSKLFYQSFDEPSKTYFDVIWLRSLNEIWRIKKMSAKAENSFQGKFVDIIRRNELENLEKQESHTFLNLKELSLQEASFHKVQTPVDSLPLTKLFQELFASSSKRSYTSSELWTEILSKGFSSATAFLVLMAAVPISIAYRRHLPIFLIYSISLFSFFAFIALIDALKILSTNQIISPFITMGLSYGIVLLVFGNRYRKTTA